MTYDEVALRDELRAGHGFVLHGPPTAGKSRTLFEIVRGMNGWIVVSPKKDVETPPSEVFEELFAGRRAILLLEDLNDYAEGTVDLSRFVGPSGLGKAQAWAVAATCRDGAELGAVKESVGRSLRRFYDQIRHKLALVPQTAEEKGELAQSAGRRDWASENADDYPTPGTIVMEDALVFMRGRYDVLPLDQRDVLRALKLLTEAGVLPLFHWRVEAVVEGVYHRQLPHLDDYLENLGAQAFLHLPGSQDPIVPEYAYLRDPVIRYSVHGTVQDDFPALLSVLEDSEDAHGVAMLGLTYARVHGNHASALEAYDVALGLNPGDYRILVNRGVSLLALGRSTDALADFDEAIGHAPDEPIAHSNRAAALGELGRPEEALAALDAAFANGADMPETHVNRATVLKALERHDDALEAVNTVLESEPDHAAALSVRGSIFADIGLYTDALRDLDASLRLRKNSPKTQYNRGLALYRLGKFPDALDAFDAALNPTDVPPQYRQDPFLSLYHRAMTLVALDRDEDALESFSAALDFRPEDPPALYNRGVTNLDLGRYKDALADFEAALKIQPDHSDASSARKFALNKLNDSSNQ
jgi:tetratricopeptide (TPR) repeat protein